MTTEPLVEAIGKAMTDVIAPLMAQRMCVITLMAIVEKHVMHQPDLFATVLQSQLDRLGANDDAMSRAIHADLRRMIDEAKLAK